MVNTSDPFLGFFFFQAEDGIRDLTVPGVQTCALPIPHPAGAGLPLGPRAVAAQSGELLPRLAAVARPEQPGVFHAGVRRVRIGEGGLEVPNPLELPGVLRAVVPLMRGQRLAGVRRRVVDELVALAGRHAFGRLRHATPGCLPRLASVAGALDDLSEPPARLRRVQPVRVDRRALEVVDLPPREVRATDVPPFALAVRCQDERALARADQDSYSAHGSLPLKVPRLQIHRRTRLRQTRLIPLFAGLGAQPLLLLAELRLERGTEVVRLEHLANLHFALLEGRPLQPFDRLVQRFHLPQPETGDQLFRLGERPVDHRTLAAGEPEPWALGARLEPLAGEEHAGFLQFLIELAHLGQDLFVRKHARFRLLVRLHDDHDSHRRISSWFGVGSRAWPASTHTTSEGFRNRHSGPPWARCRDRPPAAIILPR